MIEGKRPPLLDPPLRIRRDPRGRALVYLGRGHPLADKSGQQYLGRWRVMEALGRKLFTSEHVHHRKGKAVDELPHLEVLAVEYHGSCHARAATVAGWRDERGRFTSHEEPVEFDWPRSGPILGPAARVGARDGGY
jgi:hypothetical protein